ncbi:tetratricopeptide repeat protein [Vibrio cholerae]
MTTKKVPLHSANLLLLLAISSSAYAVQNNLKQWDKNSTTFQKAYTLLQQHGASLDVELFEEHPAEYQAYLLGSYSVQAHDYLLAIEWLKRAYEAVEKLNEFTQQSVLYQLGYSYAQLGQLAESETWYRRAIAKGSADACVNLGVMFETKKQFQQAEQLYLSCLPDNESALCFTSISVRFITTDS